MDFGDALRALRDGKRVARLGWPDAMWLVLIPGSTFMVTADRPLGQGAPHLVGARATYQPHIDKMRPEGLGPWAPTHAALLATDWEVRDES